MRACTHVGGPDSGPTQFSIHRSRDVDVRAHVCTYACAARTCSPSSCTRACAHVCISGVHRVRRRPRSRVDPRSIDIARSRDPSAGQRLGAAPFYLRTCTCIYAYIFILYNYTRVHTRARTRYIRIYIYICARPRGGSYTCSRPRSTGPPVRPAPISIDQLPCMHLHAHAHACTHMHATY